MTEPNDTSVPEPPNPGSPYASAGQPGVPGGNYAPQSNPGQAMGVVGLVLAFLFSPAGIIVSAIALHQSRKAGRKNGLALAGLITGIAVTVVAIVSIILVSLVFGFWAQQCFEGSFTRGGMMFSCGSSPL